MTTDRDREAFEAWCADTFGPNWATHIWPPERDMCRKTWQAALTHARAQAGEPVAGRKVPDGQTPLDANLKHRYLDVIKEGEMARESGTGSPYHGHSLEHCLHAVGWVHRDLRIALDQAKSHPAPAQEPVAARCEDCPPVGYPTDRTRCTPCDRRAPDEGACVRCGAAPRNASGLCATCVDEDAVRAGEVEDAASQALWRQALDQERVPAAQADYERRIRAALEPSPSAWNAGAEAMRAKFISASRRALIASGLDRHAAIIADDAITAAIRALPLPTQPGEG